MPTADRWYFAYGSNLSTQRMQDRVAKTLAVASAEFSRIQLPSHVAFLKNYRLAFNNTDTAGVERYANIVPSPGSIVWGAAYWCSPEAMQALDRYEGVEEGCYSRQWIEVETIAGESLRAEVYIGGPQFTADAGKPSDWYLQIILLGAKEHGLPEEHIREIERLAKPL